MSCEVSANYSHKMVAFKDAYIFFVGVSSYGHYITNAPQISGLISSGERWYVGYAYLEQSRVTAH